MNGIKLMPNFNCIDPRLKSKNTIFVQEFLEEREENSIIKLLFNKAYYISCSWTQVVNLSEKMDSNADTNSEIDAFKSSRELGNYEENKVSYLPELCFAYFSHAKLIIFTISSTLLLLSIRIISWKNWPNSSKIISLPGGIGYISLLV